MNQQHNSPSPEEELNLEDLHLLDDIPVSEADVQESVDDILAELNALEADTQTPANEPVQQDLTTPEPASADPRFLDPNKKTELLPDETALAAAGLKALGDSQLEQIMQEAKREDFLTPGAMAEPPQENPQPVFPPEEFKDQEFRHAFGEGEGLASAFQEDPAPAPVPQKEKKLKKQKKVTQQPDMGPDPFGGRKRRPKRKKGYGFFGIPHILVTAVWLAIILFAGVSLGRMLWLCAEDMLGFGREEKLVQFTYEEGITLEELAEDLKEAGLIRYPSLFVFYGQISDIMNKIDPGTYTLNACYDYMALKNGLVDYGPTGIVQVVIPEGYNCRQVFALLEEKGVCTVEELEEYAANGELDDYWFLDGVVRGTKYCLEGFLFPDTYDFYLEDTPRRVLEKLLDAFDYRFTDAMRESIDELNALLASMMRSNGYSESYIESCKLSIRDVVIVASLVEEEIATHSEGYTIASVIYNRLTNPGEYPYLNIDATIIYALGEHKSELTAEDLRLDHPYNTYLYRGLPPGPITNPGIDSLKAALDPEDTNYHFYALNPETGLHHFSRNSEEHENFLESLRD